MWPFKQKTIPVPYAEKKSLSLPQAQPSWYLYARFAKGWVPRDAVEHGYNQSSIVNACVEKRAKLIASVPLVAMRKNGYSYEPAPDSDLQRLLNRPNPEQSTYELMYGISQALDLAGNAFVSEIRAGMSNQPQQLWLLPSQNIRIKPGSVNLIDYFEYTDNNIAGRKITPEDMIHIKMPNPGDILFGMPVLKSAAMAVDVDREAAAWQKTSLQNRGLSDLNVRLPDEATPEQIEATKKQFKQKNQGSDNARSVLVTNADIQQLNQTAVELDFVNSRRATWTEICAVFGLSLANLGMTESVNLANAKAMDKALWQNTIIPQLELITRALTHQLASEYGDDWVIQYDLTNVEALQTEQAERMAQAQALFAMGVPFNAINQRLELGFDDVEGGDIGYLNAGLLPVGFEPDPLQNADAEAKKLFKAMAYGE